MKTLVINGSPRGAGSNTMNLTHTFLEGAGWTNPEIIDISKVSIAGCNGCFSCWEKTPGKCVINDSMTELLPKLIEADIVIWSFPLYNCSFPGKMKCFMDRQLPISLPFMDESSETGEHPMRYDLSKQRHFYISTCGFWTAKGNYDSIIALLEHGGGSHKGFTIFCGQGELFNIPDPELKELTNTYLEAVRKAGEEFAAGEVSEKIQELLTRSILPKEVYESFANGSWEIEG